VVAGVAKLTFTEIRSLLDGCFRQML